MKWALAAVAALVRREQAHSPSALARPGGRAPVAFVQLNAAEVDAAQARSGAVQAELAGREAQPYGADCACDHAAANATCSPSKVHLQQDRESSIGLSLVDASRIFESQGLPTFAEVKQEPFYCLDDRVERPGLATPGGDLGEFVLALTTYQQLTAERQVTQHMVDVWLEKYVKSMPQPRTFVHCTDDRALRHLRDQLQDETLDLQAPPEHAQSALLTALTEVPNLGDAHFRLMLKEPENYHVDPALVQMTIRSFYSLLWDSQNPLHSRVQLVQLTGAERPTAFLEVMTMPGCTQAGLAPLLASRGATSLLISSMDAVHLRREELADFFALRLGSALPMKVDRTVLLSRLDRHGLQALELTGSRVAKDLPFYSLHFN